MTKLSPLLPASFLVPSYVQIARQCSKQDRERKRKRPARVSNANENGKRIGNLVSRQKRGRKGKGPFLKSGRKAKAISRCLRLQLFLPSSPRSCLHLGSSDDRTVENNVPAKTSGRDPRAIFVCTVSISSLETRTISGKSVPYRPSFMR